ncbi:MAG: SDR family oxidoreductase [Oscillospiraceae bacterium]|nr:SDR family oxidoreductase [Oscillospiraceae bacterium]
MFDLTGKVAVVTGGSSGLGVQFAHQLGRQGASVVVIARREHMLKQVAEDIANESGVKTGYYKCDVTDSAWVARTAEQIVADFGKIDIAVNCAGGGNCAWTEELPDQKWHATMDVNINGLFYCCREFGKAMIKNGYGRMVNISSMLGVVGMDVEFGMGIAEYAASKGAVNNLTRQLAVEWARFGITVNAIAPGFFASEVSPVGNEKFDNFLKTKCPMKREGHPGELDSVIAFLTADESRYVTGQIVGVDGGWTAM